MTINTGDFVHTSKAHANNVYEVKEVGDGWLFVDDNTVMGWSIPTETATVHEYCGNKWCRACHRSTYNGLTGDVDFYVRKTGEAWSETTAGKFERLNVLLDLHGLDKAEILKGVDPTDDETVSALLFLAERVNPNVSIIS